jgi:hypothetical protein
MNKLKEIAKIIFMILKRMSDKDMQARNDEFVKNIRENVDISLEVAGDILKRLDIDTEFKTRGVTNALAEELTQELFEELDV